MLENGSADSELKMSLRHASTAHHNLTHLPRNSNFSLFQSKSLHRHRPLFVCLSLFVLQFTAVSVDNSFSVFTKYEFVSFGWNGSIKGVFEMELM